MRTGRQGLGLTRIVIPLLPTASPFCYSVESNQLIKIYGRESSPGLRPLIGGWRVTNGCYRINSFQLSDICSRRIMTPLWYDPSCVFFLKLTLSQDTLAFCLRPHHSCFHILSLIVIILILEILWISFIGKLTLKT